MSKLISIIILMVLAINMSACKNSPENVKQNKTGHTAEQQRRVSQEAHDELSSEIRR